MFLGKVRILIITASLLLTFFGLERLCHMATDGFALARITHPLQANGEFPPPILSSEETMTLKKILSQPFHYLSCGGQTYVFTSDDGHYVIKFLKFHHRRIPLWMQKIPLPNRLSLYLLSKMTKKEFRLKRNFRSYIIAYNHFKEETGMIYHHLETTTNIHQHIVFFDKLGYRYVLDLDKYAFLIQKKGLSTYHMINNLMKDGRVEEAKEKLSQLLTLSVKRCQKGIGDRDFKFKSNLGFIDNIASQIDLGSLSLDERYTHPDVYKAEINHSAQQFRSWLEKEHPILVEYFDEKLALLN